MHYAIALLYGLIIWLAAVAFTLISAQHLTLWVIVSGPFIISGLMVFIFALDWLIEIILRAMVRLWNRMV